MSRGAEPEAAKNAPAALQEALRTLQPATPARIAEVTTAAVQGLGSAPSERQISGLIYAAVRALPDGVLEIVRAAVPMAPPESIDAIVVAAITAVPNPWKQVVYQPVTPLPRKMERDFKGDDGKGIEPAGGSAPSAPAAIATAGGLMTLAEAIVLAACEAAPGADVGALFTSAEGALRGDPAFLIGSINDPRGISGVGDAGNNNYANEPVRRRPVVLAPTVPATVPTIPPVSQ